ncbi:MAG: chromosomal replication initiator protein DnaA [bacterium]|nr:chromosomal replication initiator protein DnaA [bacterium]
MEKNELWQTALGRIEQTLSRPSFVTWFRDTGISNIESGIATIVVPSGFAKEWLKNKYHKVILHTLREIVPEVKDVQYLIGKLDIKKSIPDNRVVYNKKQKNDDLIEATEENMTIKELTVDPETNLNPRYTFANFIVGSFNELAHATAQSIIKNLGTAYNPLFIYGGVGLGKTHLIQAIGNEVLKNNPYLKVRYLSSEKFMSEIVDALRRQEMNKLKDKYRSVDLLIMDDIQFIARTEKMQEEFFHTFNSLFEKNKQIIISSDRPPQAIAALEKRLLSRFEGGMTSDIGIPDMETRFLILKTKLLAKNININEDILYCIAENIKTNVRELEGALNKIIMTSKLNNSPITIENTKKIIFNHQSSSKKFVSAKKIIKAVSEFYEIEEKDFLNRSRKKDIVKPRQVAMFLMREELKYSYPSIGEKFGGRDHTTAIHSCEKIAQELKINSELEEELRVIKEKIYSI